MQLERIVEAMLASYDAAIGQHVVKFDAPNLKNLCSQMNGEYRREMTYRSRGQHFKTFLPPMDDKRFDELLRRMRNLAQAEGESSTTL